MEYLRTNTLNTFLLTAILISEISSFLARKQQQLWITGRDLQQTKQDVRELAETSDSTLHFEVEGNQ